MKSDSPLFKKLYQQFSAYNDGSRFFEYAQNPHYKGLRVNTLKISTDAFLKFGLCKDRTPFCKDGFYIQSAKKLGNHPLHHAGAFYLQEPSAMSAVTALDPKPGDRILDLCAAPGGKSTQIAAGLCGKGLLVSNEIVKSRANILLSNMERMGVSNAAVTSCHPDVIAAAMPCAFDKILVDAPCSGEGMIRKDPAILDSWSEENVAACAVRQLKILNTAARCLIPGGILIYSTCTFSKEEDEGVIEQFLKAHPEFSLQSISADFGRPALNMPLARRILWNDGGEGHFVARLIKSADANRELKNDAPENFSQIHNNINAQSKYKGRRKKHESFVRTSENGFSASESINLFLKFAEKNKITFNGGRLRAAEERLYLLPDEGELPCEIPVIRFGVLLGNVQKGRFVPAHAMYACPAIETERTLSLPFDDSRCLKFLHGEEILADAEDGYWRVAIEGVPLGFGKLSGGRLKNGYPKGLRTLK